MQLQMVLALFVLCLVNFRIDQNDRSCTYSCVQSAKNLPCAYAPANNPTTENSSMKFPAPMPAIAGPGHTPAIPHPTPNNAAL